MAGGELGDHPEELYIGLGNGTIMADRDLMVRVRLVLHSGTLAMGCTSELLKTPAVFVHNTGELSLGTSTLDAKVVTYAGNGRRSAGVFWRVSSDMASATAAADTDGGKRSIVLWQECPGDVDLEVALNDEYTVLGGDLTVYHGSLDLNGQNLVAQERRTYHTSNAGSQEIHVGATGSTLIPATSAIRSSNPTRLCTLSAPLPVTGGANITGYFCRLYLDDDITEADEEGRVCDSVSGPGCSSGSVASGGSVSSGNPSNGIHVGWSRASASRCHPKTVLSTWLNKAGKYTQALPKVIAVGGAVEYGGTSRADVKDVVVLKYPETG